MPKPNSHTTKRSAIELQTMALVRRAPTAGVTTQKVAEKTGKANSTVSALLNKLTAEGYLTRTYEYTYDSRAKQQVGHYVYRPTE